MESASPLRNLGRVLYTQNPFYLISCFLILYGLQATTLTYGDSYSRSLFLGVSIAAYTVLMALTSVGVVRLGKVWEDARSIFLVVIISLVALSTGLDELCNSDWQTAALLLSIAGGFAMVISEFVIRACGLRFPSWYRLSYYALLIVFFASPIALGYAVANRELALTRWGSPVFSVLIAVSLLLLAPAMRRGPDLVRHNGTPWRWPLYPLSAFVILAVLAGIRTHAIWMSFGFMGSGVRFEPFLLLPIAFAIFVLWAESDATSSNPKQAMCAMGIAPIMLLCGASRQGGMTFLPIQHDLELYFGSGWTIAIATVALFYLYCMFRRLPLAIHGFAVSIVVLSVLGKLPVVAAEVGIELWMISAIASLAYLVSCLRLITSDARWFALTISVVTTMLLAGQAYDDFRSSIIIAASFALIAFMIIGACFDTVLAAVLRRTAGGLLTVGAIAVVGWHLLKEPGSVTLMILAASTSVTLLYLGFVRRLGWVYVAGVQTSALLTVLLVDGYQAGVVAGANLPIQSGILCFLIAVGITVAKTGFCHRFKRPPSDPTAAIALTKGL